MPAGDSNKPLAQKLGIKRGFTVAVINPPENYWDLLETLPDDVAVQDIDGGPFDLIHVFTTEKKVLERNLERLKDRIAPDGMIWVSWPKKSSKVQADLNENVIRELALGIGLVDVKVVAVDETWSGLKLVIRLKDRK
jgi:hypothetical protein